MEIQLKISKNCYWILKLIITVWSRGHTACVVVVVVVYLLIDWLISRHRAQFPHMKQCSEIIIEIIGENMMINIEKRKIKVEEKKFGEEEKFWQGEKLEEKIWGKGGKIGGNEVILGKWVNFWLVFPEQRVKKYNM